MEIQMWADIVCPWCGLGLHRLDEALRRFAHADEVTVVHRSFQLNPDAPVGVAEPVAEMLTRQRGMDAEQLAVSQHRIEELAHADGIESYHVADNLVGNTLLAHEFLAHATVEGVHARAWHLLFDEYFGNRTPIWTVEDLLPFADRLGLDPAVTREALEQHRYRDQVEADQFEAEQLGGAGVPLIVVDRRYGMAGAQPPEQILAMIEQAWGETPAT